MRETLMVPFRYALYAMLYVAFAMAILLCRAETKWEEDYNGDQTN